MKRKYIKPETSVIAISDELLAPQLSLGSVGKEEKGKFYSIENFKIVEEARFDTEDQKKAFWNNWDDGAD